MVALSFGLAACSSDEPDTPDAGGNGNADTGTTGNPDTGTTGNPDTGTMMGQDAGPAMDTGVSGNDYACPSGATRPGPNLARAALNGTLTVWVVDVRTDGPLAGAEVIVEAGSNTWQGTTDARGCLRFEDAALTAGATNIHLFATGRRYLSVYGLPAEFEVIALGAPTDTGPPPPVATVSGMVTGWDVLTATTSSVARVAFVNPLLRTIFGQGPEQPQRQGVQLPQNIAIVGSDQGFNFSDYTVTTLPDFSSAILISAGTATFPPVGNAIVEISHMGLKTGLDFSNGNITGLDVDFTTPIDQVMTVSHGTAPSFAQKIFISTMTVPDEAQAILGFEDSVTGDTTTFDMPSKTGDLASVHMGAGVQVGGGQGDNGFSLKQVTNAASMNVDVGDLPAQPSAIMASGRTLSATFDALTLSNIGFGVNPVGGAGWQVVVFGSSSPNVSVTLPAVPAGMSDPLTGTVDVEAFAQGLVGFDPLSAGIGLQRMEAATARTESVTF